MYAETIIGGVFFLAFITTLIAGIRRRATLTVQMAEKDKQLSSCEARYLELEKNYKRERGESTHRVAELELTVVRAQTDLRLGTEKLEELRRLLERAKISGTEHLRSFFDSISVPAMVVDPNDDKIRAVNTAAQNAGWLVGSTFRSHVHVESLGTFNDANQASDDRSRGYTLRLKDRGDCAVVRSLAFTKPMEGVGARSNDRLTFVTTIGSDEERVLALRSVTAERKRLGSLLKHGLAKTASVIAQHVKLTDSFRKWLMIYHERRIEVISELLAKWDAPVSAAPDDESTVLKSEVVKLVTSLERVAYFAAEDEDIRRAFGWANGILSENSPVPPIDADFDQWPESCSIVSSIPEASSFVFEELIANAFKHGAPGRAATIEGIVVPMDGRTWVQFTISNTIASFHQPTSRDANPYGGLTLVREACRLLRWQYLDPEIREDQYSITVRARTVSEGETLEALVE